MEPLLMFSRDFIVHAGSQAHTSSHQLPMAKLVIAMDGPLSYHSKHLEFRGEQMIAVAAGHPHGIGCEGDFLAFFVCPRTALGQAIEDASRGTMCVLDGATWRRVASFGQRVCQDASPHDHQDVRDELAGMLTTPSPPRHIDPRIMRVLERCADAQPLPSLDELASASRLSRYHLSRLFGAQMGHTLRRHLLWEKLWRAMSHIQAGATLTDAALLASFSDHAHLTRTMRACVGQPPSFLVQMIKAQLEA